MRRRTIFLVAGLLAYFVGASVRVYLRQPELCECTDAGCRIVAVIERPRAALLHPVRAIEYLVAPVCND
jgi:hypothetical protein